MRKLRLSVDDLRVATFQTHTALDGAGTVLALQTEPASVGGPCTGTHCTYPVQLCHGAAEKKPAKKPER